MASFEPFVSSDPFSMSTFNSKLGGAFGKVDADVSATTTTANNALQIAESAQSAATELASKIHFIKLGEWSLSTDSTNFEITLPSIDWTKWKRVHVDCRIKSVSVVTFYLNVEDSSYFFGQIKESESGIPRPLYTFEPGYSAERFVSLRYVNTSKQYGEMQYSALTKLIFLGVDNMVSGSSVILWGEE